MKRIYDLLWRVLARKKHNVTKLKWEKARLELEIDKVKESGAKTGA